MNKAFEKIIGLNFSETNRETMLRVFTEKDLINKYKEAFSKRKRYNLEGMIKLKINIII